MIEIYKASAGSGKTFTLTREYIKLILGRKDENGVYHLNSPGAAGHRAVLAITFTNKATEEMKGRIIHELSVVAGIEPGWTEKSPYEGYLCQTFDCTPAQLARTAAAAVKSLLFDFDRFNVSTIDAFFQTVLRAFAHEADVSGNYEVELDDTSVIASSIDRMLQDLNREPDAPSSGFLVKWLTRYMIKLIEEGKAFNVFNRSSEVHSQLISFIDGIMDDTFKANYDEIMDYLSDSSRFLEFIDALDTLSGSVRRSTAEACRVACGMIESAGGMKSEIQKNILDPLAHWSVRGYHVKKGESRPSLSKTVMNGIADISSIYKKGKDTSPLRTPELDGAISAALLAMDDCCRRSRYIGIIMSNLYQLGLLSSLNGYLDRYRRENSTILLSDTNALLAKIIGDEDSPFLYEKIGNTYNHYLVDEFQDTSYSQWQNLSPLLGESLASSHDSLVIGDEKQCIYRFRDSDPSLLQNLHNDRVASGRSVVRGKTLEENTNWRSSADVVRFNNTLFSAIARRLGFEDIYANVAQRISPKHLAHRGYVRLGVIPDSKESDPREAALAVLADNLRRQLESGYRAGDIAVLVRRWREGDEVIKYLESVRASDPSFPYFTIVSDKSLLVSRSAAVSLIVSHLRFMSATEFAPDRHKRSRRDTARIINAYEAGISGGLAPGEALLRAVDMPEETSGNMTETHAGDDPLRGSDMISLVESIIARNVPGELLESENVYIATFQDLVLEFVARGRADIRSFLNWWDETGWRTSVSGAKDPDALNILTIHKSKGLEYPCVHIPFGEFTESNMPDWSWFRLGSVEGIDSRIVPPWIPLAVSSAMKDTPFAAEYERSVNEKQLDRLNLLYVAFTRAVEELIVSVKVPVKEIEGKTGDDGEAPSPARFIYRSLLDCDDEFCWSMKDLRGVSDDEVFSPLRLDDTLVVEVGRPTVAPPRAGKTVSAMEPSESSVMKPYALSPDRSLWENTRLEKQRSGSFRNARERGLVIHDVMSRILTVDDVDRALNMLEAMPDMLSAPEEDRQALRDLVSKRVTDPEVREWFEGFRRVFVEREVMTAKGEIKRFDRVVWTASGEIHLIDYKSGSQPYRRYVKQIKGYIDFFKSIGYPAVRGFLYYLDSGKIIEVD